MWEKGGLVRDGVGLAALASELRELPAQMDEVSVAGTPAFNRGWHEALRLEHLLTLAPPIVASAAERKRSRGSRYRLDFLERDDKRWLNRGASTLDTVRLEPVTLTRLAPGNAPL